MRGDQGGQDSGARTKIKDAHGLNGRSEQSGRLLGNGSGSQKLLPLLLPLRGKSGSSLIADLHDGLAHIYKTNTSSVPLLTARGKD